MGNLPADISDMEGGFPYDFTMPTAIEISQLVQFNLVRCLMVAFPEYSWGDWMDLHGGEAGVFFRGSYSFWLFFLSGLPLLLWESESLRSMSSYEVSFQETGDVLQASRTSHVVFP